MKRTSREKRQRPQASTPRPSPASSPPAKSAGPRDLKSLSRAELMTRILELQAQEAARAAETPPPTLETPAPEPVDTPVAARAAGLVIDSSVRSGQTIEFPDGDVTVIGSVGSGAEIVAGGSIHVYGTLRGRAIAGTSGDPTARIFCQDLDAELLSIDGRYRVAENFDPKLRGRPVQARLDGMRMAIVPLETNSGTAAEPTAEERAAADKIRRATDRVRQLISIGGWRETRLTEAAAS